jgi:hypothetical protein
MESCLRTSNYHYQEEVMRQSLLYWEVVMEYLVCTVATLRGIVTASFR